MAAVPEFGNALLKPLGAPSGKFETFIEVPFKLEGKAVRPDGVIVVTRAGKSWSALLEAKIAAHPLEPAQINAYLDLARELDVQAVLSVSNQYVTSATEYPIEIDRRKIRRTKLHHWSWIDLLTQATVQKEYRGVSDPDQAYILGEPLAKDELRLGARVPVPRPLSLNPGKRWTAGHRSNNAQSTKRLVTRPRLRPPPLSSSLAATLRLNPPTRRPTTRWARRAAPAPGAPSGRSTSGRNG